MQVPTCAYLEQAGYQEYRCRISGASVDTDCGNEREALSRILCLPRKALQVRAGSLRIEQCETFEREVIQHMVEQLSNDGAGLGLEAMNEQQLDELISRANQRKRGLRQALRSLPRLEARAKRLRDQRVNLDEQIEGIEQSIAAIGEGRVALTPVKPTVQKSKAGGEWTPERRAAQAARMRAQMSAKSKQKGR